MWLLLEIVPTKASFYGPERKENAMFVLAIMVQLLLICLSPELAVLAEKIGRRISDKLNLGVASLAFILVTYAYFWLRFLPTMNSLGVNLTIASLQASSLYIASFCLRKLHEDALSNENRA